MTYFVTGATGFIGRFLVQALLQRSKGTVYVLVRPRSVGKLDELREFWGKDSLKRVVAIKGDLGQPKLGVGKADITKLKGKIKHFYHLGAVYDLEASAEAMQKANIVGTQGALDFASAVNAGCFHLVSSIAAAGLYRGTFTRRHVRGGRRTRPSLPQHQARLRGHGACQRQAAVSRLSARHRARSFADRLHRQDRRSVLLLQGAAEAARIVAALGTAGRCRRRLHEHGAGRLRGRCARASFAPAQAGRRVLPPDRPEGAARRRNLERLRARGACAGNGVPARPEDLRDGTRAGRAVDRAQQADPECVQRRCCATCRFHAPCCSS